MDVLKAFADFLNNVLLPQNKEYAQWINESNSEQRLEEIRKVYKDSFDNTDPFELDLDHRNDAINKIKALLDKAQNTLYANFNETAGYGIPDKLLKSHLGQFIQFYKSIFTFTSLQSFVDIVNEKLGTEFCNDFQRKRIEYNKNGRVASNSRLFGDARDDYWTINLGAEREVQYHLYFNKVEIGYGLAFNAQPSRNNPQPIVAVKPFINSFFYNHNRIAALLPDYRYIVGEESVLKKIAVDDFVCFGKTFTTKSNQSKPITYEVDGLDMLEMIYDLRQKQFDAYKIIFGNSNTSPDMKFPDMQLLSLLNYKKQIILQGPPGTGKTKLAKELASGLTGLPLENNLSAEITDSDIIETLKGVTSFSTVAGKAEYEIQKVDPINKLVVLRKSTDNDGETDFTTIQKIYKDKLWNARPKGNDNRRTIAIAKFIFDHRRLAPTLENSTQFKLIQFHPSYSYEDFVRGIVSTPNEEGDGIIYEAENKVLAKFAELAHKNYESNLNADTSYESDLDIDFIFDEFVTSIEDKLLEHNHRIELSPKLRLHITEIRKDAFRIASETWKGDNLKFSQIKKLYKYGIKEKSELHSYLDVARTVYHRTSYYFPIVQMFREFVSQSKSQMVSQNSEPLKNYVLIIDEINRANLSSVLGELIYALEYRGSKVESMYEVDGTNELILPPNLYIIGTMNTADRSVGHIDYAIRRRFAFVPVPPENLTPELGEKFHLSLFNKVTAMFNHDSNLSREFESTDVQLGHSYFIDKSEEGGSMHIRLKYEIKPILLEYVKDGILIGDDIKELIAKLEA